MSAETCSCGRPIEIPGVVGLSKPCVPSDGVFDATHWRLVAERERARAEEGIELLARCYFGWSMNEIGVEVSAYLARQEKAAARTPETP